MPAVAAKNASTPNANVLKDFSFVMGDASILKAILFIAAVVIKVAPLEPSATKANASKNVPPKHKNAIEVASILNPTPKTADNAASDVEKAKSAKKELAAAQLKANYSAQVAVSIPKTILKIAVAAKNIVQLTTSAKKANAKLAPLL